jgi:4-hydroxythreonine-4-phosphate dehydrogenase
MKKIAISVGDLSGVGIEIALKAHDKIKKYVKPLYCINREMLEQSASLLGYKIPNDFEIYPTAGKFQIEIGKVSPKSGLYSFNSFVDAVNLAIKGRVDGVCTLPINKESWAKAKVPYHGHTHFLGKLFRKNAIMMLGCEELFVALFTEHIPLREVFQEVKKDKLALFLEQFYNSTKFEKIAVLGLNPHASDNGVMGDEEEKEIVPAIAEANRRVGKEVFYGPVVPDTAFISGRGRVVALYHDQGLAPLKSLYFEKSINVTLNLPILRTSVDHGTAFDIAYQGKATDVSYIESIKYHLKG